MGPGRSVWGDGAREECRERDGAREECRGGDGAREECRGGGRWGQGGV